MQSGIELYLRFESLRLKALRHPLEIWDEIFLGDILAEDTRGNTCVFEGSKHRASNTDSAKNETTENQRGKGFQRSLVLKHGTNAYFREYYRFSASSLIPVPQLGHRALISNSISSSSIM